MKKNAFILLFSIVCLALLYFLLPQPGGNILWAAFAELAGLYCSRRFKNAILISSPIALAITFLYIKQYPFAVISVCIIFISMIPIPYYFHMKSNKRKKEYFAISKKLKIKRNSILSNYKESLNDRQRYEKYIEKIMQSYIIGNKISKCVSKEDFAQIVLRTFESKPGIIGCAIFEKIKFNWLTVSACGTLQDQNLIPAIHSLKFAGEDKKRTFLKDNNLVSKNIENLYLPIVTANELLGAIVTAVHSDYAEEYIEEALFFIPQISVALKRIKLFYEIMEISRIDGLTGLYLKRYFLQRLDLEMQREKLYSGGFYILMLDLDFFKNINDKYGHLTGDKVLSVIAKKISASTRPWDLCGRYGGEEFIVFLPLVSESAAEAIAQKIRAGAQDTIFNENGIQFNVTLSIGISCNSKKISDIDYIISTADKALYKAKSSGRNQVVVFDKM